MHANRKRLRTILAFNSTGKASFRLSNIQFDAMPNFFPFALSRLLLCCLFALFGELSALRTSNTMRSLSFSHTEFSVALTNDTFVCICQINSRSFHLSLSLSRSRSLLGEHLCMCVSLSIIESVLFVRSFHIAFC